jgi:hypothetical protein
LFIKLISTLEIHERVLHAKQWSWKTYHQAIFVQTNIRNNSSMFKSDYGTSGPMRDSVSGSNKFNIKPRQIPVELNISAFYADTSAKVTAKAIKDPKYASSNLKVDKTWDVSIVFTISQDRENDCPTFLHVVLYTLESDVPMPLRGLCMLISLQVFSFS